MLSGKIIRRPGYSRYQGHSIWNIGSIGIGSFQLRGVTITGSHQAGIILVLYRMAGVSAERLFLSYYGTRISDFARVRTGKLRNSLGIREDQFLVGNISYMYPPKYHLGHRIGLKCHEDLIDAVAIAGDGCSELVGVLVGCAWEKAQWYERKLRRRAKAVAGDRILMPGYMPLTDVGNAWSDFDCVIHVPFSENCGGVVEPLLAGVPVIASRVGGLTEVILDNATGKLVSPHRPGELAEAILEVRRDINRYRRLAKNGQALVTNMFDVKRTADEIYRIYEYILNGSRQRPPEFDSRTALGSA